MGSPIRKSYMTTSASAIFDVDMFVAIRAANEKTLVSNIEDLALVIIPAPAIFLAGGRAAIPLPIAVGASTDSIELIQIQFLVFLGTVALDLLPNPISLLLTRFFITAHQAIFNGFLQGIWFFVCS